MPSATHPSVVIVGAGVSGLTAAHDLRKHGFRVRVVEPRDRVGGRVLTIRGPFAQGQHAEAGGELIEGEHEAVRTLAASLGLRLIRVLRRGFGSYLTGPSGRRRPHASQVTEWRRLSAAFADPLEIYERAGRSWDGPVARVLARRSLLAHAMTRGNAGGERTAVAAIVTSLRGFYAADPDALSTLVMLDQLRSGGNPGERELFRIQGGNDRLAAALAKRLGSAILLRREVVAIAQTASAVRVAVRDRHDRLDHLIGDYVIVTAPVAVVRRIRFDPTLPAPQRRAIATLPYGPATKTLLQCARPFWRRPEWPRAFASDLDVGAVWDGSEEQRGRAGILVSMAGGRSSAAARALFDARGADGLLQQLAWLGTAPPLSSAVTTWEDDPWAGGAYAFFGTSFDPGLRRWLAMPAGRILFAGEHTSVDWQGYINGAVTSGQRAAAEVLALAGRLAPRTGTRD